MAKALYNVAYQSLFNVYTSPTGLLDIRTGYQQLGGGLNLGDYVDFTEAEAKELSQNQSIPLHAGRYRFVQLSTGATAANIKYGTAVGIAPGTQVAQVVIANVGSGQTAGTYQISSSTSGGTAVAVAQVVVGSAGTIISATLLSAGAGFTSTPTFSLTAIGGSGGSVLAQMYANVNVVTDASAGLAVSTTIIARGLFLNTVTSAQVTAGAYVFIQESGIGTALGGTVGSGAAVGTVANAVQASGAFTAASANTFGQSTIGYAIDTPTNSTLFRVFMTLPIIQG